MLGDNEATDIKGADRVGWESVLITTGVTKHESKIATYTVSSLPEALAKYGLMWCFLNSINNQYCFINEVKFLNSVPNWLKK